MAVILERPSGGEALAFDDVLLTPGYSAVLPADRTRRLPGRVGSKGPTMQKCRWETAALSLGHRAGRRLQSM